MPSDRLDTIRIHAGWCWLFEGLQFQPRKGISKNIVHTWDMLCFKISIIFQTHKHQPSYLKHLGGAPHDLYYAVACLQFFVKCCCNCLLFVCHFVLCFFPIPPSLLR